MGYFLFLFKLDQFLFLVISKTDKTILFVIFMLGRSHFLWLWLFVCRKTVLSYFTNLLVVISEKKVFCNSHVPT